eukprot:scaffold28959_cov160-Skeletonema_menzelii.AAC.4
MTTNVEKLVSNYSGPKKRALRAGNMKKDGRGSYILLNYLSSSNNSTIQSNYLFKQYLQVKQQPEISPQMSYSLAQIS